MANPQDIEQIARKLANGLSADQLREQWESRRHPGERQTVSGNSQALAEYWERVFSGCVRRDMVAIRELTQEMEYEAARKAFWKILQIRAEEIRRRTQNPEFQWEFDETGKAVIQNMIRYFINDPAGEYPLTKGLFVYGEPGTGKTEIMQAFCLFCRDHGHTKRFEWSSMSEIYVSAKTDKEYDPLSLSVTMNRCFDEFARYTGPVMRFGDLLDITEAIVEQRHGRFMRYGQFSHFIANATPNELSGKISPMILDRLREMCTGVLFTGKSKRK